MAEFLPVVRRSAFSALACSIPILALLAMTLDAVLPRPDPATGQRADAWLLPVVLGGAAAVYLVLLLSHLYLGLVRKESVARFTGRQVRRTAQRIAAAAERVGIGQLLDLLLARAVALALVLVPLLGLALLWWIGRAAFGGGNRPF